MRTTMILRDPVEVVVIEDSASASLPAVDGMIAWRDVETDRLLSVPHWRIVSVATELEGETF